MDIMNKKPAKILIVESNAKLNKALSEHLTRAGYFVDSVFEGKKALKLAKAAKPNLIILDTHLPDMHGFSVLQTLKKPQVPLIYLFLFIVMWQKKIMLLRQLILA